jgi:hypothetical protein
LLKKKCTPLSGKCTSLIDYHAFIDNTSFDINLINVYTCFPSRQLNIINVYVCFLSWQLAIYNRLKVLVVTHFNGLTENIISSDLLHIYTNVYKELENTKDIYFEMKKIFEVRPSKILGILHRLQCILIYSLSSNRS